MYCQGSEPQENLNINVLLVYLSLVINLKPVFAFQAGAGINHYFNLLSISKDTLVFKWTKSDLQDICQTMKSSLTNVHHFNFSFNHLHKIEKKCFYLLKKLQFLQLNNNKLQFIGKESFVGPCMLLKFVLSSNKLTELSVLMFDKTKISIFNVIQNNFKEIDSSIENLKVNMIITDDYRICWGHSLLKKVCMASKL